MITESMIKDHMRALSDLEEINSDPCLKEIKAQVDQMMSERDPGTSEKDMNFVRNSLFAVTIDPEELKSIRVEIKESDVSSLTAEWVNEWHLRKQSEVPAPADEERRKFIAESISEPEAEEHNQQKTIPFRRYVLLAAAALIGVIILIGTLTPSSSPEQLFVRYYESFPAMTSVTRGDAGQSSYNKGIEYYKAGNYSEAAAALRLAPQENPATLFYLGLSELENNNTDKAISALELAAEKNNTFYKETRWYLALAYLKKGNTPEASRYLKTLSGTEGTYGRRAARVLRLLK